jgi:hypothetical protein
MRKKSLKTSIIYKEKHSKNGEKLFVNKHSGKITILKENFDELAEKQNCVARIFCSYLPLKLILKNVFFFVVSCFIK